MRVPLPMPWAAARSLLGYSNEDTEHAKTVAWLSIESGRRIFLLLERYGINKDDPDCWFMLAFNLARKHEPGFAVEFGEKHKGAPRKWDSVRLAALYHDVMQLKDTRRREKKKYTLQSACFELWKREPWKNMESIKNSKTLENRFREAETSELLSAAMFDKMLAAMKDKKNFTH